MYLRQYDSWSYSPLDRINTRNVADLVPVWTMSTGTTEGHQAPPIVNDGVMFVTTPFNQVIAIDAKTGDLLWRYRHQMPADIRMGHPTNRGVALYGDKVYTATSDARVVALDAKTGAVVWNKAVENYNNGYYMTIAPLAARGRIMVGVSGGERGIRGFVVALDAQHRRASLENATRFPRPASPATTPGPATRGAPAARPSGSRAASIRSSGSRIGAPATRARGPATRGPATTSTRTPSSRSTSRRAR